MSVIQTKPNVKLMWASQGYRAEPTTDKQMLGWEQEIPPHEIDNWIQYKQDLAIKYLYQEGIPEWDSSFEYNTTSYVKYNGVIYKLKDGAEVPNTAKQPDIETTSWEVAFEPYGVSFPLAEEIRKIKEVEGYLSLYVSKANPVMTGIAIAPEFQATADGGHTFQNTGVDTGMFLNSNNEPEFRINNNVKGTVRNSPSLSSNDTTFVTTAMLQEFKNSFLNITFPIGLSIITQDPRNPSEYLGFGTWERDLEGRALVGFSSDVTNTTPDWKKTVNNIYGKDEHTLTNLEVPAHNHVTVGNGNSVPKTESGNKTPAFISEAGGDGTWSWIFSGAGRSTIENPAYVTSTVGGGQPHNNVQMSKVKYIWTRTA